MAATKSNDGGTVPGLLGGAATGAGAMGLALARTRLAPGWKGGIAIAGNVAAAGIMHVVGLKGWRNGFLAAGVIQGGYYIGTQIAITRYLGAPDSKQPMPLPAGQAAAQVGSGTSGTGTGS